MSPRTFTPALLAIALAMPSVAMAGNNNKVDVCHITGNGSINILNVSSNALSTHLAHGDHLAGTYFFDADGDGEGDAGATSECLDPGFVDNSDDCDDGDAMISTQEEEVCGDGVDNNCDGQIDEDCTVMLEVHANADNAVWAWVDGVPVDFDYTYPSWQAARRGTVEVATGADHAVAFYVEDWGGLTYFVASVRVDGVAVAVTGDGDFRSTGSIVSSVNEWPRINDWANVPSSAADSLNLLFSPGTTWGDWMQAGFNDSGWQADTNLCSSPSYWNINWLDAVFPNGDFGDLAADGAALVTHHYAYTNAGQCSSPYGQDNGQAYRVELSL